MSWLHVLQATFLASLVAAVGWLIVLARVHDRD